MAYKLNNAITEDVEKIYKSHNNKGWLALKQAEATV